MSPVLLGRVSGSQAFASLASLRRVSREVFEPTYVDDVFSTFLYQGNDSTQTINNGIDISGEGGLVWVKDRDSAVSHVLAGPDLVSDGYTNLASDLPNGGGTETNYVTSFSSNGFSVGNSGSVNGSPNDYVSWSFRKAPGFFDVVTYSGNGSTQTIPHNLGSVPGMILVKRTDSSRDWAVYHRSLGNNQALKLNDDSAARSFAGWGNTTPTSNEFYLGVDSDVNNAAGTYVAYLFAHDDQSFGTDEDEAIIKCGSYTGTGGYQTIDIGFEAQWVLIKGSSVSNKDWGIFDIMRGTPGGSDIQANGGKRLKPNATSSEDGSSVGVHNNGFLLGDGSGEINTSGVTYTYMAIRRPHKPPEAAMDVFAIDTSDATSPSPPQFTSGFVTDFVIRKTMDTANATIGSRLQNIYYMSPYNNTKEDRVYPATALTWDFMDGWSNSSGVDTDLFAYMFKRAPGFMDVIAYQGTGSARTLNHNLGAVPELVIIKNRTNSSYGWATYTDALGRTKYLSFGDTGAATNTTAGTFWGNTDFTSTQISLGTYANTNHNNNDMIAYLFASLNGISKVGTYSGTGSNIDVNCGFSAGARFVMIKRIDTEISGTTGTHWYIWDTTNGIVSGNDPYWKASDAVAAVTNTDYIDPLNEGFTVTSSASANSGINASGGTYMFFAIA